jgi:hypothetical protein
MFECLQNGFVGFNDSQLNRLNYFDNYLIIQIADPDLIDFNIFEFKESFFVFKINFYKEKTIIPLTITFDNYHYKINDSFIFLYLDVSSVDFGIRSTYIETPFSNHVPNYDILSLIVENPPLEPIIFNHSFSNLDDFTFFIKFQHNKYLYYGKLINSQFYLNKKLLSKYPNYDHSGLLQAIDSLKCNKLKDIANYSLIPFVLKIDGYNHTEYYQQREFINGYFYNYISLLSESCFYLNSFLLHCIIDLFNDLDFKNKLILGDIKSNKNEGTNPSVNSNFRLFEQLLKKIKPNNDISDIQLFFAISEALVRNFFAHGFQSVFMPLFNGRNIFLKYSKTYTTTKNGFNHLNPYYISMEIDKTQDVSDFIGLYQCNLVNDFYDNSKSKEYIEDKKNNKIIFNTATARNFLRYNFYNNTLSYFFDFPTDNQLTLTLRNKSNPNDYNDFVEINLENTLHKLIYLITIIDTYCEDNKI